MRILVRQQRRQGAITVWVLVCLGVIIGVMALGLDGGRLLDERRRAQNAADAAALAAAVELYEHYWSAKDHAPPHAARAAVQSASVNGFKNDGTSAKVTVHVPPLTGAFAGRDDCAEVLIDSYPPRGFSNVFTGDKLKVKARAVALGRPAKFGLLALRTTGPDTLLNNSLTLAVLNNRIVVNSDHPSAFHQTSLGLVVADNLDVTGGINNSGGAIFLGRKNLGVSPTPDPLRKLPQPIPSDYTTRSVKPLVLTGLLPTILDPGVYQGGIQVKGLAIVILKPGMYVMEGGGFEVSGVATVIGLDVTIFNTEGAFAAAPIDVDSLGKVVLTAPRNGPYRGITMFQDCALTQPVTLKGAASVANVGTVYAPSAAVNLSGLAAVGLDTLGGAFIADTIRIDGAGSINIDLGGNPPAAPEVTLVE